MIQRITEFWSSFKASLEARGLPLYDLLLALLLIAVGFGSFILGRFSMAGQAERGVRICTMEESILTEGPESKGGAGEPEAPHTATERGASARVVPSVQTAAVEEAVQKGEAGAYVASKSGKAYHLPWCPGAQRIKEENKVWFQSKEEAEAAGYTPAGNCKGL